MNAILKRLLFALGIARAMHRWRNRHVLTALMFHRVLPPEDPRAPGANPTYTITRQEFAACLDLFRRWYSIVDLAAVERAAAGAPLPPCPMLITFDDGWRDNLEYALPELRARGLPALLFVATDFIGDARGFWQERVYDQATFQGADAASARQQIAALAALAPDAREARLAALPERPLPRCMADGAELHALEAGGMAIGGHGASHTPMTDVADPAAEFAACRAALAARGLGGPRPAFSFPHGRCSQALVAAARQAGFGLCFTSATELVPPAALLSADGIGRTSVDLAPLRSDGGIDLATLAFSLLLRPHAGGGG